MSSVGTHENITLWSYSEVVKMDGYVGNFTVTIKRKPRYINEDVCTGWPGVHRPLRVQGAEVPRRVQRRPRQAQAGVHSFPQATPQVVLIDPEVCLNFKRAF